MRVPSALCLPVLFWTGCQTIPERAPSNPVGFKPRNANNVVIKVSLRNRMVYVMEGDRPLLVTATAIGTPSNPTPKGRLRFTRKIANKRSNTYGFWVNGDTIVPGKSSQWMLAYGFHVGSVWPIPRTHGCLRLHQSAAREFFELAQVGTPVYIPETLPEDATLGQNPPRPQDYNDPDPPKSILLSSQALKVDPNQYLREQP